MTLSRPYSVDMSKDTLLVKYVHGKTQNANEVFNNLIWKKMSNKCCFFSNITHVKKTFSNQLMSNVPGNQPAKIYLTVN